MLKKIIEIVLNILIIITIILVIYALIQIKVLKKDYINLFNFTAFEVITGSMSPTIEIGDMVVVEIDKSQINVGDIIVFKEQNSIITHRVTEIKDKNIITKGDANNAKDKPIKEEYIIGKVIKTIPKIRNNKKGFNISSSFYINNYNNISDKTYFYA